MQQAPTAGEIIATRIEAIEDDERIDWVVEGEELVMVQTESGATGVAMRPERSLPTVEGDSAIEVIERGAHTDEVAPRALGVATLNAIDPPMNPREGLDPFRSLSPAVDHVAMVGFFGPVFGHLDVSTVDVLERNPAAMEVPDERVEGVDLTISPPEAAPEVIPGADVLFITGSTLVFGGLGDYLSATAPDQPVILVGASSSFAPAPLFEAGVTMVGGASPRNAEDLERAITDGECESNLHDIGLQKWAVLAPDAEDVPGLELS
ncbi:MAG: Rossmann-like domain-containing protein [Halodesulfurarchaeum sp.]